MLKVGLTGNYFVGIEDVVAIFRRYEIPLFDADLVIKWMLFNSSEHIDRIRSTFGSEVFDEYNILDLSKFNGIDKHTGNLKFHILLKILEFDVITYYERWRLTKKGTPYTIFKSQILFEFGFNTNMNINIAVFKPEGMRVTELQTYHGMKAMDVYDMLETEMDALQKNRMCTYTIHNYESYFETVERQISQIHRSIKNKIKDIKEESVKEYSHLT